MCVFRKIRMMRLERELEYVRNDRDRNELYLKRILKEVDQKVIAHAMPVIRGSSRI